MSVWMLKFFPALALGLIVEYFLMHSKELSLFDYVRAMKSRHTRQL